MFGKLHNAVARPATANVRSVEDDNLLDELLASSHKQPVVLFLHDPWCPISARARR